MKYDEQCLSLCYFHKNSIGNCTNVKNTFDITSSFLDELYKANKIEGFSLKIIKKKSKKDLIDIIKDKTNKKVKYPFLFLYVTPLKHKDIHLIDKKIVRRGFVSTDRSLLIL